MIDDNDPPSNDSPSSEQSSNKPADKNKAEGKITKAENKDLVKKQQLACSFCSKTQGEVQKLIAGPGVYICNDCVAICEDIVDEQKPKLKSVSTNDNLTPRKIVEFLDQYIIGQEEAKKILSVAVYNHYKRLKHLDSPSDGVELQKSNILLVGPTGSGKTLLAQTLAKLLDVPFTIADATTLTEAGYVGEDVENILVRLLQAADYDISRAERGIVYIDEIDKISRKSEHPSITRDVSGEGVQQALLKIIEGTVASVPPQGGRKHPQQDFLKLDTSNILFICGGSFAGIEKIIEARSVKTSIGFHASVVVSDKELAEKQNQMLRKIEVGDFIKYGLIPEFIGRLPVVSVFHELDKKALIDILTRPKNALLKQFQTLFLWDGAKLSMTDDALDKIAELTMKKKTGARGLRAILERLLNETMFALPDWQQNQDRVNEIIVNGEMVDDLARTMNDENPDSDEDKNAKPLMVFQSTGKKQA